MPRNWSPEAEQRPYELAIGTNFDGTLELFAVGGDGNIYGFRQASDPSYSWGSPLWFGGNQMKQVSVGRNEDGRLELFAVHQNGHVYHRWKTRPNDDFNWTNWTLWGQ